MARTVTANDLAAGAKGSQWVLDPEGSSVKISHKTMWGLVNVKGRFTTLSGEGAVDPGGNVSGRLVIDAASIDTKNKKRDEHLRSADFFDVEHHPHITVEIASASLEPEQAQLAGSLDVRGTSAPLELPCRVIDAAENGVTLTVETIVDRDRFGLGWNKWGMIKGLTSVVATARFRRSAA